MVVAVFLVQEVQIVSVAGNDEHDKEGRLITAEYEKFFLVGAYVPNSGRGLVRLKYRKTWNQDFLAYIKKLDEQKPVIYTGDLNVAHKEIGSVYFY
jgi:exonuclease III